MKRIILLSLLLMLGTLSINAQKVKFKKKITYIDSEEYMRIENEYGNYTVSNLDGKEIVILKSHSYDVPNPARNNTHNPNRYKYPATIKNYYHELTFLDFELVFETDTSIKDIFRAFYKYNLIDEKGDVIEDNAKKIRTIISKDISNEIPTIIISN